MSISIITIHPNNFEFVKDKHYNNITQLQHDYEHSVEVQPVPFEQMMDTIITNIEMVNNTDLHGDTITFYETDKHIYQICFLLPDTHPNKDVTNVNKIAEYLCCETIYGTCVILCSKINEDYTCSPDNIDIPTLTDIIYRKFVHKGLFISYDDAKPVIEYDFLKTPLEYDNTLKSEEYRYHDIDFLGFTLSIFIKNNDNTPLNKRATKLLGNHKINGDIMVAMRTTYEYNDLTNSIYHKIIKIAEGSILYRKLRESEKESDKKINNLPIAYNKYIVLENRYREYKDTCHSCSKPFEENKYLTCTGCYRLKYHNTTCQNADWDNHKKECLFNKVSINSPVTK